MAQTHLPLVVDDQVVGDLVIGAHSASFYSVRRELRDLDGRTFRNVGEVSDTVASRLRGTSLAA